MPDSVQTMVDNAACLCGLTRDQLLRIIAANVAEGCGCQNLEGPDADPTGIYTPTFIGQVYVTSGHVWQATGLTSADWSEICEDCVPGVMTFEAPQVNRVVIWADDTVTQFLFPNLTTVTDALAAAEFFFDSNLLLETVSIPLLATIGTGGTSGINNCPLLTIFSAPSLTTVGGVLSISQNSSLATVSLPLLQSVDSDLAISANGLLTAISLPALVSVLGNISWNNSVPFITFSAPVWVPTDGTQIGFFNCALDDTSVNHILHRCVLAAVTTCDIDLSGGTSSGPTGAGVADKATLIAAGNTVATN